MARPFWSGQIQISLVSFGVNLFPATDAKSEIHFHQLSRKTGRRVKHQKVSEDEGPLEKPDIVKGYEYRKGEYVRLEPEEIEHLRIASRRTFEVAQFVDLSEIRPEYFEKPYFVTPESEAQAEAFAVIREALQLTQKAGIGKIAFGGREHLLALASPVDNELAGMMAFTMRYAEELRNPAEYFSGIKKVSVDSDQLSLAKELIKRKAAKFAPEKFADEYEVALRAMVEAKVQHLPLPSEAPAPKTAKVINLMDALRKSIRDGQKATSNTAKKKTAAKPPSDEGKRGIALVKSSRTRQSA